MLLVGFSLEPLLQSICHCKPNKVLLVLNEEGYPPEGWHDFADHVNEAVLHLGDHGLLSQVPEFFKHSATSDPASVFKILTSHLHEENESGVIIDVTGGKKSMIAGAFMYAAYTNSAISYVDFDRYDRRHRRPYGYSCKITRLLNPYQEFALREWEQVKKLYQQYQFRYARELLSGSISSVMARLIAESKIPLKKLQTMLKYYENWDLGDFRTAKHIATTLDSFDEQPSSVTELGGCWYKIGNKGFSKRPEGFYDNLPVLKVYIFDELERIGRLIKHNADYRSAFLRTAGVNEIVLMARVVRLVTLPAERDSLLDALDKKTPGAKEVFKALRRTPGSTVIIADEKGADIRINVQPITVTLPSRMDSWWKSTSLFNVDDGWNHFLTLRNELAHKYFSVPRGWAEEALGFAQANFEDFIGRPMTDLGLRATALPWSQICELCGISRFLPVNLR